VEGIKCRSCCVITAVGLSEGVKNSFCFQKNLMAYIGVPGSSSPLCLLILKEGSRVRQKHNCLGIVFITAIVTTCFGRAWPSSGHNVDVVHK
jgi:hypothetical protein